MTAPNTEGHVKPVRLAAAAWRAEQAGKWQAAADLIVRIDRECGPDGTYVALMCWCDWYVEHALDGKPPAGKTAPIAFIRAETGQLDGPGSDRVPPEVEWAGRFVSARYALDTDACDQLLTEIPAEPATAIGSYILKVLEVTALTVNGLPRGFATMGQGRS